MPVLHSRPGYQNLMATATALARGEIIVAIKERARALEEEAIEIERKAEIAKRTTEQPSWGMF